MIKEKIIFPVGDNKALVYETSTGDQQEQEFIEQCKTVAATRPGSIQDFFVQLADLQKNWRKQRRRKRGRHI